MNIEEAIRNLKELISWKEQKIEVRNYEIESIETLLTAYENEKVKNKILEIKNIKLCDDILELIKQNPYDKNLHYKYVETPKIEPQWYEKEE